MTKASLYILLLCSFVLSACDHKELCYQHPHDRSVLITFDWSRMAPTELPQAMKLIAQRAGSNAQNHYFEFDLPPEGGLVSLPEGHYELMAYNTDSPVNVVEQQRMTLPAEAANEMWRFVLTTPPVSRITPGALPCARTVLFGCE